MQTTPNMRAILHAKQWDGLLLDVLTADARLETVGIGVLKGSFISGELPLQVEKLTGYPQPRFTLTAEGESVHALLDLIETHSLDPQFFTLVVEGEVPGFQAESWISESGEWLTSHHACIARDPETARSMLRSLYSRTV